MTRPAHELIPTERILMGPGPSNVNPRVLRAMAAPVLGHLDPQFLAIMDDIQRLLRKFFRTKNQLAIPVSGTGSAGMEACIINLVEEGDRVIVVVNGFFGERMCEIVQRCRGTLVRIEVPWGKVVDPEAVGRELKKGGAKVVCMVHAETSTGALQPMEEMGRLVHDHGALLLVDAVTSLGGHPLEVDAWGIDACYSGTQKCLGCPPGLAPVTFSPAAREALNRRKTKVPGWYLDLSVLEKYWGAERTYHHTAPVTMNYALLEGLKIIEEEGLEARWDRHRRHHLALVAGLEAMGLKMVVEPAHRLWPLNTVWIPNGVDDGAVRRMLLERFNLEIGGGLGEFKGRAWRVGIMGHSCNADNVLLFLNALEYALRQQGFEVAPGQGAGRAMELLP